MPDSFNQDPVCQSIPVQLLQGFVLLYLQSEYQKNHNRVISSLLPSLLRMLKSRDLTLVIN